MINFNTLPKNPEDAALKIVTDLANSIPASDRTLSECKSSLPKLYNQIKIECAAIKKISARIQDRLVSEIVGNCVSIDDNHTLPAIRDKMVSAVEAINSLKLSEHFLDPIDIAEIDQAELNRDEREDIRGLLDEARNLTAQADFLPDNHKRRVLFRISKVEEELFKDRVGLEAFLAAAAEISGVVRTFGEDAEPIAKRIQEARTKTERKITAYQQIEMEEAPKQIEDKSQD